jgi:hypothetical protein
VYLLDEQIPSKSGNSESITFARSKGSRNRVRTQILFEKVRQGCTTD